MDHRNHRARTIVVVSAIAGSFGAVSSAVDTAPVWKAPELISADVSRFEYDEKHRYLAYDNFGEPAIAFVTTGGQIHLARRPGPVGWASSQISPGSVTVENPGVAFDQNERPAVTAGTTAFGGPLHYLRFDGFSWNDDTSVSLERGACIAFDALNNAHVFGMSLDGASMWSVQYARDLNNNFTFTVNEQQLVIDGFSTQPLVSFALGLNDEPMAAIIDQSTDLLDFAQWTPGTGWLITPAPLVGGVGSSSSPPSLAVNPLTGFPAIAMRDNVGAGGLTYAEFNGVFWQFEFFLDSGNTGFSPSLAFDPADGNPAIAYRDAANGNLRFAWRPGPIGTPWQTQTVATGITGSTDIGYAPSLAFNEFGNGFPGIAFIAGNDVLAYVEDPPIGDLNSDSFVNGIDLLLLLNNWGNCPRGDQPCIADVDRNGQVNGQDLLALLNNWLPTEKGGGA